MSATTVHREDVKAILRKRYGSLEAFQVAHGLEGQQVRDLLRGKSKTACAAVAEELGVDPEQLVITSGEVPVCGDSKRSSDAHGQNAAAAGGDSHRLSDGAAKTAAAA